MLDGLLDADQQTRVKRSAASRSATPSFAAALKSGTTHITDDAGALIKAGGLDVVVEATGIPQAGIKHALAAIANRRHVVMVCV